MGQQPHGPSSLSEQARHTKLVLTASSGVAPSFGALARLCWRDTLIDAAIFRDWMVGAQIRRTSKGAG
jgi:hypothetical protein